MPRFIIERNIPDAGAMNAQELQGASRESCNALRQLGPDIQWIESYVTGDKIYCVYRAPDERHIREHAELSGFPADEISQVSAVIDPTTAEG